ncbi:MAG: sigma-70 family RNA polymerase sigma factor [Hyphomicrobiaceae bacterium]|nr:sigma-70 family RNA polymerase sigma factor [Hyphomicrobiaceae bacterium]
MTATKDDRELLARLAKADQAALRSYITRHQLRVFRFIIRCVKNEAVAEELTNEVFMDVWRHASKYEGRSQPVTWLLSIAHNRAISSLRKRREEAWDDDKAGSLADEGDDPEVVAQKTDKSVQLRACLEQLSAEHKEIIDLVYYHEMSIAEVSEVIGIPEATVKTRMFYARKKLSDIMKANGIDRGWP